MKSITIFNSKRKNDKNRTFDTIVFCLDEMSARSSTNQIKYNLDTPGCGVMCDEETFAWLEQRQEFGSVVIHKENFDQIKKFRFYKEIAYFKQD